MEYNFNRPDFPLKYRSGDDRPHTLPLAPRNVNVTSPFLIGVIDIRWDNPAVYAENNGLQILGVNVYKAYNSPEAAYVKINDTPIGALYCRDQTKEVTITEDPLQGGRFIAGTTATGDWIAKTYHKPIIISGTNGQLADSWTHVRVDIKQTALDDFITVPAFRVKGESGEIYLINSQVYNHTTNRLDDPVLPQLDKGGEVRITYTYIDNWIQTDLFRKIYYKVTTVAFDNTCEGGAKETPLNEVEAFSLYDMEKIDWIWAEAIRRNKWILEQGGERVKLFLRKWSGYRCDCWDEQYRQGKQDCHVCFPAGTEITMNDFTRRNIEDIKEGDEVLTHKGNIKKVNKTMNRVVDEDLINIKSIHGIELSPTKKHPVLVLKKKNARCIRLTNLNCTGCNSKPICNSKCWNKSCSNSNSSEKIEWVSAENLEEGDYLVFPVPKGESESFSESQLKFMGYYAAEGWTSKRDSKKGGMTKDCKRVLFGFNRNEIDTCIKELQETVKNLGHNSCISYRPKIHKGATVNVSSVKLVKLVTDNVGKYSKEKQLSNNLVWQKPLDSLFFLGPYFNGDGCQSIGKYWSNISSTSASYQLTRQIQVMLMRCGIIPNYSTRTRVIPNPLRPGEHSTTSHELVIGKSYMNILSKNTFYKEMIYRRGGQCFINSGYIFYPIKKIAKKHFNGVVYNLEVEDDNSYVANGVAAHNCFGTGYIGGYEGSYDLIVAPPETEKTVNLFDVGLHVNYNWSTWGGPYPLLTDRDFVVRQNNDRFSIAHINAQGSRGAIYQQHFELSQLDQSDIRYQVPINGGQTSVPPAYNQYREPRPTDASPVINDKPERPEQYQYKGRTVTFENIVMTLLASFVSVEEIFKIIGQNLL